MVDRLLVPIDGSEIAKRAAQQAFDLARDLGAGVHVVFVVDESPSTVLLSSASMATVLEELHERGVEFTEEIAALAAEIPITTRVLQAPSIPESILQYADANDIDLVVMGTRGRHGMDHLLGSTTERVLARSSIPVLVVPAPADPDSDTSTTTGS